MYRGPGHRKFAAFRVDDPNLISELQTEGVQYSGARRSHWFDQLLSVLVPAVLFFGIWFYVVRIWVPRTYSTVRRRDGVYDHGRKSPHQRIDPGSCVAVGTLL